MDLKYNQSIDRRTKLKNHAGNEELIDGFRSTDVAQIFSIFGPKMEKKFLKEQKKKFV